MLLNPIQARAVLEIAARRRFALLAINADAPAAVQDVLDAARLANAPVIIETSLWQLKGRSFGCGDAIRGLARYLAQVVLTANHPDYAHVPVIFHTDHIKGPQTLDILRAAMVGVNVHGCNGTAILRASTISLDSSELTEVENISYLVGLGCHAGNAGLDLTLEMEAGVDDGITDIATTQRLLGGVEEAAPGYLALYAPGVGTRHGFSADGFPAFSVDAIARQRELAARICGRAIGIAVHGSSGLDTEELRCAVAAGVTKVNWSSESLLIRSQAAAAYYARTAEDLQPMSPRFKATAMDDGLQASISATYVPEVIRRIKILGGSGQAEACMAAATGIVTAGSYGR